jgi:hypothetical protein
MSSTVVAPSPATNLRATLVAANKITLAWKKPAKGTAPLRYTVKYRRHGTITWYVGARTQAVSATITLLQPHTAYDIEVVTTNT